MADRSLLFDDDKPEEDRGSLAKAAGLAAVHGTLKDIVAPAAEGLAALTDDGKDDGRNFFQGAARATRRAAKSVDENIPAGRRADRDAALFPEKGQRSVAENPLSTLAMKLAGFASVGAMYAGTNGVAAATALGTAQGVYGRVSDVHGQVENMSDAELGQKYPVFDKYVNMGFSPKDARKLTIDDQLNPTSMTEAGLGGAAGGGLLGKVFHGAGGEGFVRTALGGAKHGAIGMGAMGAANELAAQTGDVEAGARAEYDPVGVLRATGNSAAEGLVLGAGGAGIAGGRRAAGNWGGKRLIEIANRENKREANPTVTELPTDGNTPAPDVIAATEADNPVAPKAPKVDEEGPSALDQQIAAVPDTEAATPPVVTTPPVAEVPPKVTAKTKKTKAPSPEATPKVEIAPHETLDQIEAKVAAVPGEEPSEAAKALPEGLPTKAVEVPEVPTKTKPVEVAEAPEAPAKVEITPTDTLDQIEAKVAPAKVEVAKEDPTIALDRASKEFNDYDEALRSKKDYISYRLATNDRGANAADARWFELRDKRDEALAAKETSAVEAPKPIVGKLTTKKPVTALQEKIATAVGVTPGGSTSVKVERVVKGNKVQEARRERERAAENAKLRAEGKPVILKGNSEAAETPEARDTRIAQEAKVALNEADRVRKANSRFEAKNRDDNRAKNVVEDLWKGEDGKVDEKGLSDIETKALGGDTEAKAQIVARAKNVVTLAKNQGVVTERVGADGKVITVDRQRSRPSQVDKDNRVQTPWLSFVQEAARFVRKYGASDPTTPLRDANLNIVKGKTLHDELIQRYVSLERAMRSGDLSHADRIANNGEFTEARKEAAAKKAADGEGAGEKDFDANQKNAATRTNEVEEATHDAIDAGRNTDGVDLESGREKAGAKDKLAEDGEGETKKFKAYKKAIDAAEATTVGEQVAVSSVHVPATAYGKMLRQRFAAVEANVMRRVKNTKLVIVPDAVMEEHNNGAAGVFHPPTGDGFKHGYHGIIVVGESHAHRWDVTFHEAVHAATAYELERNPQLKADVTDLFKHAKKYAEDKLGFSGDYGFKDVHEFLAEALSNHEFQLVLENIPMPKKQITRWGTISNAWAKLVDVVGKTFGARDKEQFNVLQAAMRAADEVMNSQEDRRYKHMVREKSQGESSRRLMREMDEMPEFNELGNNPNAKRVTDNVDMSLENARPKLSDHLPERAKEYWDDHRPSADNWRLRKQRVFDKLANITMLANNSDHLYGTDQPARKMAEFMGRMATEKNTLQRAKAEPLIRDMDKAQRKYDHGDGKTKSIWEQFSDFVHDETTAGVDATRPLEVKRDKKGNVLPTSKERWYGEAMHPELNTRWKELVRKAPELAGLRERMHDYFRETQNQQSLGLINNALKVLSSDGKGSPALAQRLFEGKATDADKKVLGGDGALKAILEANKLSKISGPYVPLMRRGEIVVQGRHHIETPANAKRFSADDGTPLQATPKGNIFEFNSAKEAEAFIKGTLADKGLRPERVQRVNVDPKTGSKFGFDEDGTRRRLTKEETNTDEKYRVTVNDSHVEFHETAQEAKRAKDELVKSGLQDVNHLDLKRTDAEEVNNKFLPQQIQNMLNAIEKRNSFKELGKEAQQSLRRQLIESGIASMGSTRAQSKRLPRRNVKGYSNELTKNFAQYAGSAAGYIARLKFQPQIDKTLQAMSKYTDEQAKGYNKDNTDTLQLERRQRLKEFEKRIYNNAQPDPQGLFHDVTNRLLQMSYLDKLASPAFHMINATEPWVVAAPVIAGRHGAFKAFGAIKDAYGTIGAGKMLGAGLKDTAKAFKDHADLTDYTKTMQDRVRSQPDGKHLSEVLQHLTDVGLLSRDAGLELARVVDPSGNMLGRALDRTDLMARQLGASIESINRSVTAVAAYRLERAKGSDHEAALKYATEVVHDSMGDYSNWNAAPMFKSPIGRLALQFRKYGQRQYYLLGKTATAAFRGDREAMKTFAGLMATHMLFAGALGLPLEPIRIGMLAAGLLGVTDKKYEDLENGIRKGAANVLGATGGEIFTRGPARWLGFDLSSRINLNSLITSGQDPKSMKDDDLWAYFAKNLAGAPASYLMDLKSGMAALSRGDLVEASRLLVPLKVYADSVQAYQMATTGKQSDTGRQLMNPIRMDQAIVKAMGIQPTGVARQNEQTFAIKSQQHAFATKRQNMINHWVMATPGEKSAQYKLINEWNQTQPKNAQVTMSELTRTMQRRQAESTKQDYSKPGIRTTKRDRHIVEENNYFVNP